MTYLIIEDNYPYVASEIVTNSHYLASISDGWRKVFRWHEGKFQKMHVYLGDRGSYVAYRYEWLDVRRDER